MESNAADRNSPEHNELGVRPLTDVVTHNTTYKDTEYAIGGCDKSGSPDTGRYANPPPQYEVTYDERDRYHEYLQQTDDQCYGFCLPILTHYIFSWVFTYLPTI